MAIKKSSGSGIPFGLNAGRPANPGFGQLYSNGEAARLELFTQASGWQNIVQEVPGVASITGTYSEQSNSGTITIAGTNFVSGAIASAIGTNGVEVLASSTTYNSLVQLTAVFTGLSNANEPYDIKVTNPSNLFGLIPDVLYVNASPVWTTPAGSLGVVGDQVSISISATATDSDSTISYTLASGSTLPLGISLNSSTGVISGTLPNIDIATTYSFTINASDGLNTIPRSFSFISNAAPLWSTASGTLATIYDGNRTGYSVSVAASDAESNTLTYSLVSGTLPTSMTLNASNGVISGTTSAVVTDTTYSFVLGVSDGISPAVTRSFNIIVKAPIVQAFSYTGSDQSFTVPDGVTKVFAKVWGAAGGAGQSTSPGGKGGAGGFSRANISVTPGQSLAIVVGAGGTRNDTGVNNTLIYGHKTAPTGKFGGQGASGGAGGGLSGIFNGTFTFNNSLIISGAGGGGSAYQSGTLGRGGSGGGANANGGDGDAQTFTGTAYGRGGTLSAGGKTGSFYFKSANGRGQENDSIDGGQLYGGHASSFSSWTETGGGGSGYYGGGPGNHDSEGGNWGNGGGGSGYANLTFCSSVESYSGTKDSLASQATSDIHYVSGVGASATGLAGGNGRVVLVY